MTVPSTFDSHHSGSGKFPYGRKADPVVWSVPDAAPVRVLRVADLKASCDLRLPSTARHRHRRNLGSPQQFVTGYLRFVNGSMSGPRSIVRVGRSRFCCWCRSRGRSACRGPVGRYGSYDAIADFAVRGGRICAVRRRMNKRLRGSRRCFLPVAIFPSLVSMPVRAFHPTRNPFSPCRSPGVARPRSLRNVSLTGGGHRAQA